VPTATADQLRAYFQAYLHTMDEISSYLSAENRDRVIPSFLRNPRRLRAYVSSRGGVAVEYMQPSDRWRPEVIPTDVDIEVAALNRRPARADTFPLLRILGERIVVAHLSLESDGPFFEMSPGGDVRFVDVAFKWSGGREQKIVGCLHVFADSDGERWSEVRARRDAVEHFNGFLDHALAPSDLIRVRALLRLPTDMPGKGVVQRLEEVILEYRELLGRTTLSEEEVQQFLVANQVLLDPVAQRILPKHPLGEDHVTDFVIQHGDSEYVLVELENPSLPLFTRKGDASKHLRHATRQVGDWIVWVRENLDYAKKHSLDSIYEPEGVVIIGRRQLIQSLPNGQAWLKRENSTLQNIKIRTYDDLLDDAQHLVDRLRAVTRPGS